MKKKFIIAQNPYSSLNQNDALKSFANSIKNGCDGIHCRVQLTKDNIPVILSNEFISKSFNKSILIKNIIYDELNDTKKSKTNVLTLECLLKKIYKCRCFVNIELANHKINHPDMELTVLKTILQTSTANRVIVSSYNHNSLEKLKSVCPTIKIGLIFPEFIFPSAFYSKELKAFSVHVHKNSLNSETLKDYKAEGIRVFAYSYTNSNDINSSLKYDIDGILTPMSHIASQLFKNSTKIIR